MHAVTQWFEHDPDKFFTPRPRASRRGWYEVKRGASKLKWRARWNGSRFIQFQCISNVSMKTWFNDIFKHQNVTAWRGLAERAE